MDEENNSVELVAKAARQQGVAPEVLEKLLALESSFPSMAVYGAKVDFSRQVARILDEAAGQGDL
ncbi:hypothetical protein LBW59_22530 [Ralstonia solanacearum]|uniref:Uncharacterized protein n=1 Tax=Ralstonia solanacearum TaxID=305 RepID=A0AAW5ZUJ8_RALSL|nr:hypothetical protein [Ralstonia solanacearum]MDB0573529.1 hypothetical protein [Ralstonia solanacearum]